MRIDINTNAVVAFTNKLEKIGGRALPYAVQNALSAAAFDVKTKTMPKEAGVFVHRKPTFFKANSKVEPAKGLNISDMKATVGFVGKGTSDNAVKDLEQQEHGGTIGGRALVPLAQSRVSASWLKNVKAGNRVSIAKANIIDAEQVGGKNDAERYTKSAIHAGKGGLVIGTRRGAGGRVVFRINSVKRKGRNTVINATPVFSAKKGRTAKPKATHFMEHASKESGGKMERFYAEQAKKQIDRLK